MSEIATIIIITIRSITPITAIIIKITVIVRKL